MSGRILMIVENLPVPPDRRVWSEARTLRDAGYEVSIISPQGPGHEARYEELEGIHIHRHPITEGGGAAGFVREFALALWWEARLARRIWRDRGFDAIHLCNPPDLLFLVALRYRALHGVPVVFDHHDLAPELFESKFGRRGIIFRALLLLEKATFRTADLVISTNESFRELAIRRGGRAPESVRVVRNGPDPDQFRPLPPDPAIRRGRGFLLGWVGQITEQAGLRDLLRALRHIVHDRQRADTHCLIIGDGPARAGLEVLAAELGVRDHVEFTGAQYDEDLVRHLSSCDVGVVCVGRTSHERSTAMKTMEYMALELPVVQYDLLELRRSAGEVAVYAEPDDPLDLAERILWLADHPDERARRGREGRRRVVEELGWPHQARELVRAYAELIGPGRG